ncbi:class I SAM-dependent methyltransferase [Deinococcus petrolearius]|uniref:Class I SAM-dependent methyltransferase n=1 Tax=Deinococcus petrolearius TaxID=1751295 RepID=A0ABW1DFH3_9DEIO
MPDDGASPRAPTHTATRTALVALALGAGAVTARRLRWQAPASPQAVRDAAGRLLGALLPRRRAFSVRLWDGTVLPATLPERAQLVVTGEGALGRALHLPIDMALGEAYLRGDLDGSGDLTAIVEALDDYEVGAPPAAWPGLLRDAELLRRQARHRATPALAAHLGGEVHSPERDRQAIEYHYDVSNAFYRLFLDERMVYSCGYFPAGTETLEEAQAAKLDLICRKLRLRPGERLLDIGCGWGGLAIYAARHYGAQVLGVTLSQAQLDEVSSVGMAEHVGRRRMAEYFAVAYRALKPGGLMLNHAIADGLNRVKMSRFLQSGGFARKYVFPDGELLPTWETLKFAAGAGFEVRDVENLREHYDRTLRLWVARLEAHEAQALALVGQERYRVWRLYMSASASYFRRGHIELVQTLLARADGEWQAHVPPSRADLYR